MSNKQGEQSNNKNTDVQIEDNVTVNDMSIEIGPGGSCSPVCAEGAIVNTHFVILLLSSSLCIAYQPLQG